MIKLYSFFFFGRISVHTMILWIPFSLIVSVIFLLLLLFLFLFYCCCFYCYFCCFCFYFCFYFCCCLFLLLMLWLVVSLSSRLPVWVLRPRCREKIMNFALWLFLSLILPPTRINVPRLTIYDLNIDWILFFPRKILP